MRIKKSTQIAQIFPYHAKYIFAFYLMTLLSGCAGMLEDSLYRSGSTSDTFAELEKANSKPKNGMGRLYIYRTNSSTKSSLKYGKGLSKNRSSCKLDGIKFTLIWESFFYIDLPDGQYEIVCPVIEHNKTNKDYDDQLIDLDSSLVVSVINASNTFVRLDVSEEHANTFQPVLATDEQGRKELMNLPYYKLAF